RRIAGTRLRVRQKRRGAREQLGSAKWLELHGGLLEHRGDRALRLEERRCPLQQSQRGVGAESAWSGGEHLARHPCGVLLVGSALQSRGRVEVPRRRGRGRMLRKRVSERDESL